MCTRYTVAFNNIYKGIDMQRRKFVKYTGLASLAVGLFPWQSVQAMGAKSSSHLMKFSGVSTQIRHGALNIPFASGGLEEKMPFRWLLDVHQNIFLKDGFQRNVEEDMNMISIALKKGDHYEALQINNQINKFSFLWKEQWLDSIKELSLHQLAIEDDEYTFFLGHLNINETLSVILQADSEYFVQVLEGRIQNEDNIMNNENGLGLLSGANVLESFQATLESKVLIIKRKN